VIGDCLVAVVVSIRRDEGSLSGLEQNRYAFWIRGVGELPFKATPEGLFFVFETDFWLLIATGM
jgi:hypothetical protein